MSKVQPVKVFWISPHAGGRDRPFEGERYSTSALFPESAEAGVMWSVDLWFATPPSEQGNPSFGGASFLVDDAPQELLRPGQVFEMYEGFHLTAIVEVVPIN